MDLLSVMRVTSLSRSTIYQYIAEQRFPASIQLGTRAVAWSSEDIEAWITEKIDKAGKYA